MKTITISIPGSATREVLKAIITHNLKHQFIGVDHNYNLLVTIQYPKDKEETIHAIIKWMETMDSLCKEFGRIFDEALLKMQKAAEVSRPKNVFKSYKDFLRKK